MKTRKTNRIVLFVLALCFASFSYSQSKMKVEKKMMSAQVIETETNVITFLSQSKDHTILVKALRASGLVDTLIGEGPFTVFAPTNEAFSKLPEGTLEKLLELENKEKLKSILTYHVISGNFNSAEIVKAISNSEGETDFRTLNGASISAYVSEGELILTDAKGNDAKVVITDKQQTNGFVHIINAVVMPN